MNLRPLDLHKGANMFDHIPLVLAQEAGALEDTAPRIPLDDAADPGQQQGESQQLDETGNTRVEGKSPGGFPSMLLPFILIIALFWFVMMGGQRREKKKRAKMLGALAKGNKVQTVGGILGTVVEVRDHDVVVKVDENANIRLKFTRSAIQSIAENGGD